MRGSNRDIRRVVVTGLGVVTPLGTGVDTFWSNLCEGRSGVGPLTRFDASSFRTRISAEVRDWSVPEAIGKQGIRRMDRSALLGLSAALEAWGDCCLSRSSLDRYEIGAIVGSSHGGEESLLTEVGNVLAGEDRRVGPRFIPRMLSNMTSAQIAMHLGLHGPNFSLNSACATGAHAVGEAVEIVRRGDAKAMVCGGTDAVITPLTLAGDGAAGALSCRNEDPKRASRPFDRERDGFVLGEGAGVLVVEEREHAVGRGARIYAEVTGYAATADAVHETRPDPSGISAARGIERALQKAGIRPDDLSAVFAHATGTRLGDVAEARALILALGTSAAVVPVTAIKGALGHLLAAAGAVQLVAAAKALQTGTLPPILNLDEPDPTPSLHFVTGSALSLSLTHILSNSFGFGGHNASLVLSRTP